MSNATKSTSTQSQLRNLMAQHTAATYTKPLAPNPIPVAIVAKVSVPQTLGLVTPKPQVTGSRNTVRLTPSETANIDAITLETHQRLGKRLTVSDVFRIGLGRINSNAPITAEELAEIRNLDRRRTGLAG